MTDRTLPSDLSTLDARRGSTRIELSDDGSSYRCLTSSLATMDELVST